MTLSRVVVLPWNVMRLTTYCLPSLIRIVTLTLSPTGSNSGYGVISKWPPDP
jgi:hypothetical protein